MSKKSTPDQRLAGTTKTKAAETKTAEFARLLGELATLDPERFEAFADDFMSRSRIPNKIG